MTPPAVDVRADDVVIDAREQELDVHGNVRIDAEPFHLTSDHLHVTRSARGVVVDGSGRVTFCPCLGAPLAVAFEGATVAPPGDLLLRSPTLELFGVKVLPAPFFWLRSAGRVGLLPPDVALRARDGLFLGGGFHAPWKNGDPTNGLDLNGGGYIKGGAAVGAIVRTPISATRLRWDHLDRSGLTIDARGASADLTSTAAWDVDVVQGRRGVEATTSLDAAARPYDRAAGEASWRSGPLTVAAGVRSVSARGAEIFETGAVGPALAVRASGALGGRAVVDATVDGGTLARPGGVATSYARAHGGGMWATQMGPFGGAITARGGANVATLGRQHAVDGGAAIRATLSLPLARTYASSEADDPWIHRVEPRVSAAAMVVRGDELLATMPVGSASAVRGEAWVVEAGWSNVLGRLGRRGGSDFSGASGFVGTANGVFPATRWHGGAEGALLGGSVEYASVLTTRATRVGDVLIARARLGARSGPHLGVIGATRAGVDPVVARALVDAAYEPGSGFLSAPGWTAGARLAIPWSAVVVTTAGADVDLENRTLLGARGGVELRDRCGCLALRLSASHRIGRPGVDAWVSLDLTPQLAMR